MPISISILGAGHEVGRSCAVVSVGGRRVMLDCGLHMGHSDDDHRFPLFELLPVPVVQAGFLADAVTECVDAVIVTHFHLDHCGALPCFTERIGYRGPILMTFPTKAISPVLLVDSSRVSEFKNVADRAATGNSSNSCNNTISALLFPHQTAAASARQSGDWRSILKNMDLNYSQDDVWRCMEKVTPLQLQQTWRLPAGPNGIPPELEITPYYAGHVIGAAMFHVKVGNESVLYTGDFNTTQDRHLASASVPRLCPDVVISESTYATYVRESKRAAERELCTGVHDCLEKGGKVLIAVNAVGRAQELCILLESFWQKMGLEFPIYFGGSLSEKANSYYRLFTPWTNDAIRDSEVSIFSFPHIKPFDWSLLQTPGPKVLFATPSMIHGGLSLQAFRLWCNEERNLVVVPGYCVAGTLGHKVIQGAKKVNVGSTQLDVKCKVKYLSFSAHADSIGIQSIIRQLDPRNVVFVHGEKKKMMELAEHLRRDLDIPILTPATGATVEITTPKPLVPLLVSQSLLVRAIKKATV